MKKLKFIVIDDEYTIIKLLQTWFSLEFSSVEVNGFTSSSEGIKNIVNNNYDCIILDYYIDEMNGFSIIEKVRELGRDVPIVILTGHRYDIKNEFDDILIIEKSHNLRSVVSKILNYVEVSKFNQ